MFFGNILILIEFKEPKQQLDNNSKMSKRQDVLP